MNPASLTRGGGVLVLVGRGPRPEPESRVVPMFVSAVPVFVPEAATAEYILSALLPEAATVERVPSALLRLLVRLATLLVVDMLMS